MGFVSWLDNKAADLTKPGMAKGIKQTGCFLLFLSKGVLAREFVQFEVQTALEQGKKIILVHETVEAHGKFDFASEKASAPDMMKNILEDNVSDVL